MEVFIKNFTRKKNPPLKIWLEDFLFFLKKEKFSSLPAEGEVSVAIVGEKKMAEINELYRKKIGPTDVLSFVYEKNQEILDGELVFCPRLIEKRGQENGMTLEEEWRQDFVHGMLHLLGLEHGKEMFSWQERSLNFLKKRQGS